MSAPAVGGVFAARAARELLDKSPQGRNDLREMDGIIARVATAHGATVAHVTISVPELVLEVCLTRYGLVAIVNHPLARGLAAFAQTMHELAQDLLERTGG